MADLFRKALSLYSSTTNTFSTGEGETITPVSVAGLPTDTEITLTFDRVDSGGVSTPSKLERITGTISGGNFVVSSGGRGVDGTTEQAHTSPVVEHILNAHDVNDLVDGIVAEHTQAGLHNKAVASDVNAGTSTTKLMHPDGFAGSNFGRRVVEIIVFNDATDVTTGDGAGDVFFRVPSVMNGMNLVAVAAQVQTAGTTGTTDIQIHNVTQAADMLTTKITIDSTETDSSTAATPAVIDTANDDVATGDSIRIDVDATSTTKAKGLVVELQFQLP